MLRQRRLLSEWNRVDSGEVHLAPRRWQAWLSNTGSLTHKIEEHIAQRLEVRVLRDSRQILNSDESRYFHLRPRRCRIREVLLCQGETPLVIARSIIPTSSAQGSNQSILRLGNKPLGAVLFAKMPNASKRKFLREITYLSKSDPLWRHFQKLYPSLPSKLWARRTIYQLKGKPILVCEVFLPALLGDR
ncbi:chorismate lyase [Polynucleobacter paludilacus]|uniref:chorismate--pyruvate lyase family protein n=1 Tax=Polynucleobacter paludilacus TaxID=1855895 RepID=UPI001BFD79DD|nr:chorismate lyase [Polynucleobacter paludilacus]QWD87467.1 chorismate lyase [Polynucleobacter paludilacus]